MINIHPKVSGMQTLQSTENYVINFGRSVGPFFASKKQQLLGTKTRHNTTTYAIKFGQCVEPSLLQVEKRNPINAVKFFNQSAVKYLRNILEKISDLSKNIFEKKTIQNSENYATSFGNNVESISDTKVLQTSEYSVTKFKAFVESLRLKSTNFFDLLNITRFLKVLVTIHGRKIWL